MKIKIWTGLLLLILSISTVVAQTKETRDVSTFTKISFRVSGKLYLKQGSPQKVEIEGKKDVLEKIETKLNNLSVMQTLMPRSQMISVEEQAANATEIAVGAISGISLGYRHVDFFEKDRWYQQLIFSDASAISAAA